ncbi:LOW QUALITY PROTEIN: hypothetical protein MC885_008901 [Smutsia gigantea]|nr:LOW QUALITY PROTEIN: hypothetical protein MC885_008901 [Smutsia gigantea]
MGSRKPGLSKIRGDQCWHDLTCMDFHYETQPVPNPMAYFLHHCPWWVHRFETLSNHVLELLVPFFIFLGRRMRILHGALQLLFQAVLIVSGNLSFLNWLTMVPSLACFDDAALPVSLWAWRPQGPGPEDAGGGSPGAPAETRIAKERAEVILQGTASPNASAPGIVWEDYEFKCKPGDLQRRPCLISPYHHRLDWLMWFAAFQVGPRGTLQVQVQPARGQACR